MSHFEALAAATWRADAELSSRRVAGIAAEVGYESESAFDRAFKHEFGAPGGALS